MSTLIQVRELITDTPKVGLAIVPSRTYNAPSVGQYGTARIALNKADPILDGVNEAGGTIVIVPDADLGPWVGVDRGAHGDVPGGFSITATEIGSVFMDQPVGDVELRSLSAGHIVRLAANSATGLPVRTVAACIAPPLVDRYTFSGQSIARVFDDMRVRTGQEFRVSVDLTAAWLPPEGGLYPYVLCEGSHFEYLGRSTDTQERIDTVLAVGSGGAKPFVVRSRPAPGGPPYERVKRLRVDSTSEAEIAAAARDFLAQAAAPPVTYRLGIYRVRRSPGGGLGGATPYGAGAYGDGPYGIGPYGGEINLWRDLATSAYVRVVIPSAGLSGVTAVLRIVSKTVADESPNMLVVEAAYCPPPSTAELASAQQRNVGRYLPPPRLSVTNRPGAPDDLVRETDVEALRTSKLKGIVAGSQVGSDLTASQVASGTFADARIPDLAGSKITSGNLAQAVMQTNVVQAVNASATAVNATKLTGDVAQAQLQTNAAAAVNAGATNVNAGKITGELAAANMPTQAAVNGDPGAATAGATWTGTEQAMLQDAYNLIRQLRARGVSAELWT